MCGLRRILPARVLVAALVCAFAVPAAQVHPAEPGTGDRVREAVAASYVHGMTAAIAREEVGVQGVPELLALLRDPACPRRDNVVAFLAYLGDEGVPEALLSSVEAPRTTADERAVLLVPHALGVMARRGVAGALEPLLHLSGPQPVAPWLDRLDRDLRSDLLAQVLNGLAWSGASEARARLVEREALEDVALFDELRARTTLEPAEATTGFDPAVDDPAARSHELGITYANHVALTSPITEAVLDRILRDASLHAARADFVEDVACCIRLARQGARQTFGSAGDGLDVITTSQELDRVLLNRIARVKVVRSIQYCSGPGTNILGCSLTPGNGMVVVRPSSLREEALLWLHELGHNVGLGHNGDRRYVMHPTLFTTAVGLSGTECSRYHTPNLQAALTPRDIGACTDGDEDDVASSADNCPSVANRDQTDANGNGVGDVCEGSCTPDPDVRDLCNGLDEDCNGTADDLRCEDLDVTGDGRVNGAEMAWIGRAFGACSSTSAWWRPVDYTADGCINGDDLAVLGAAWGCSGQELVCR